jgi:uncharacterized membrane protein
MPQQLHACSWRSPSDILNATRENPVVSIPYNLLAAPWHWIAAIAYAFVLFVAAYRAPWQSLKDESQLHVFLGTCVLLLPLWLIKTPILPGLDYHYLGATLMTLMFGWRLAVIGMSVVLAVAVVNGNLDWASYPLNMLVMGGVPVAVSHAVLRAVERWLPPNYFVYVFGAAYGGAALALTATVLTAVTILWLGSAYNFTQIANQYFPLILLLAVPEAFITGTVIAGLVAFQPHWVSTFDDDRYIKGR